MNVILPSFMGFVAGFLGATLWWLALELVYEIPGVFHYVLWNSDTADRLR